MLGWKRRLVNSLWLHRPKEGRPASVRPDGPRRRQDAELRVGTAVGHAAPPSPSPGARLPPPPSCNFPSSVLRSQWPQEVWTQHQHPHPRWGPFSPRNFDARTLTLKLPEAVVRAFSPLPWQHRMAGLLLVLESDQPMKRKISEKGHGSQEGSLLGKETIFLISEAGDSPTPGSPT